MAESIQGLIKLFNFEGEEIYADKMALIKLEQQTRDVRLVRKVMNNLSGRYWLISNRPHTYAMLLGINLYRPVKQYGAWAVIYDTDGIACRPEFDLNAVIASFREVDEAGLSIAHNATLPRNVISLARRHIYFKTSLVPQANSRRPRVQAFLE